MRYPACVATAQQKLPSLAGVELRRGFVPLRVAFLHPPMAGGGSGPLSRFVKTRREVALDLFLLAHALAVPEPRVTLSSRDWAAGIGLRAQPVSSAAIVSRSWSWLEAEQLVQTERSGRLRQVELLVEDASGDPYRHPFERQEPYFKIPHSYWNDGWSERLDLAAKTALLICLSLQPKRFDFALPAEKGGAWYGISADTVARGLRTLRRERLLKATILKRDTDRSDVGWTVDYRYRVAPSLEPFDSEP